MKIFLTSITLCLVIFSCSSGQVREYKSFESKFNLIELPINIPGGCSDRSANDPSNITKEEVFLLMKINRDDWKYGADFYYNSGCRFVINELLRGIIYFRAYLPFDLSKQISESVLLIIDNKGEVVDSISIQGSVGDNLTYNGSVTKDLRVHIQYEELELDNSGNTKITNRHEIYQIKDTGELMSF